VQAVVASGSTIARADGLHYYAARPAIWPRIGTVQSRSWHDHDLHARPEPRPGGGPQPRRSDVSDL